MNEYGNGSSRRRTGNTTAAGRTGSGRSPEREPRYSSAQAGSREGSGHDSAQPGARGTASHGSAQTGSRGTAGHGSAQTRGRGISGHSSAQPGARGTAGHGSAQSGGRGGSSYGSAGHSSRGNRGRRKKHNYDITQILMYVIGALILILVIAMAVKGCGKLSGKADSTDVSSTESSTAAESSEAAKVTVDGVVIDGLSQDQAKAAVLANYGWDMKVTYQDKEAAVGNLMEEKVSDLLEEIYAGDQKGSFEVKTDNLMEAAKAEAALIAGNWNMVAKNGGISGYDKDSGKFTFTEGSNGVVIDQEKLAQDMVSALQKKDYKAKLTAQVKEVSPDLTAAQLREKYKTIGTYTTKTTSNSNRNENIRLACIALNGTIVNPGQEFSFNNTTGARTEAKGYKPATAYLNGEIVQEPGGGVCQVSSTLYNAVIFAGLKSTERHAHSYEPSYVTPGEDAAVSYGGPDFKFVNNSDYPVAIKTSFEKQVLTTSIYGIPVLKDGVKIRMDSKEKGKLDPPAPVYEEDQTLQLDEEKVVKEAVPGSSWSTYLVTYENDKEVAREFFHNSSYRGKAATIKRNTSGVVITTEASTDSLADSLAESQGGNEAGSPTQAGPGDMGPGHETTADQPSNPSPVNPGAQVPQPGGNGDSPQGEAGGSIAPTAPVTPVIPAGPGGPSVS